MIEITRKYHFYAAHRNELLNDKCFNLHGHTYRVEVVLEFPSEENVAVFEDDPGVAMLFSEIDEKIGSIFLFLDHSTMLHVNDPLYEWLAEFNKKNSRAMKVIPFEFPTSCENLAQFLFESIENNLPIIALKLSETDSSTVTYKRK
jgi:6-pyruvoyltetrahydropterin/6-carboxytetrahydropterin synthase